MSDTNNVSQQLSQKLINEREEKEIRFIIIGKTGSGKSSLGNSLCGAKLFQQVPPVRPVQKECRVRYREFESTTLIVCDTPGLFDTQMAHIDIRREICRPLEQMVSPGPHAFLIVISAAHRFTEEEQKTIDYINEMFGSNAGKYCVLVITREEEILSDDKTVDQYFQEAHEPLKRLVAQCGNRYLGINNKAGQAERDEKVRQLLNIVRQMLKENEKPYYTNDMFKQAEKEFKEKEIETLNEIKAQTEAQMQNLRKEVQREIQENLQRHLPQAAYELRSMQRDGVNNSQSTALQAVLDFAGVVARTVANVYTANIQSRQAMAAIEAQTVRDERQDMLLYGNRSPTLQAIEFSNYDRGYLVEGSGETDSDSDSD